MHAGKGSDVNFSFDEKDEAFRRQIRARMAEILPDDIQRRHRYITVHGANTTDQRRWLGILHNEGWSVPAWPVEHGGTDWTALQRFIFEDELYDADAPEFHWIGSHMVGPVLYTFGSQAQMDRFLEPIRSGEELWAQGFSEPGAGSDLASLRTHARRDGDRYIVNGGKIWTSGAFEADWGFFLVKTDLEGKPQESISVLLIDLTSPGITIRRIPHLNGEAHLCQVFLDDVEVPAENLVGEEGKGWTYAKFLLDHERTTSSFIFWIKRELRRARDLAATIRRGGRPLAEDPVWALRLAKAEADVRIHEWSVLRVLSGESSRFPVTAGASVLKLRGSELQQSITELHLDLMGARSLRDFGVEPWLEPSSEGWPNIVPGRVSKAMMARAATIYGGSKQIQKNILAKLALGL